MPSYYALNLAAERLKRCYDLATPAVQRYLDAEIEYVRQWVRPNSWVLELGCGYGRVLKKLASTRIHLIGIDTSYQSLAMGRHYLAGNPNVTLAQVDATKLAFGSGAFELVFCIQNGVSAFHVDPRVLFLSAARAVASGGRLLFSTYAERFWEDRLEWFRIQAAHGLIGEIDESATGDGRLVCKDGFTASTLSPSELRRLASGIGTQLTVETVDNSSVFCNIALSSNA